jgi:myo-inositol 2-dehydrogenase / D-chiro-inositol 1-dehydrogenase
MTRRQFAGATGALAMEPQLVRGSQANSAIRMGIIGCGERGLGDAKIFERDGRVRFTAICDIREEQMAKFEGEITKKGARRFRDFRELLQSDVDAVLIATPAYIHPEQVEAAVLAGKHVYCEKPVGVDVSGCRRILRTAAQVGPKQCVTVGLQNRYGPGYRKAEEMILKNTLGPIRMARSNWIASTGIGKRKRTPAPPEQEKLVNWHVWRQYSGDILVEQNIHGVDVLNWFLGGVPVKAQGTGGRILRTYGDSMDHLNVTFTYRNGVRAMLAASQFGPNGYRVVNEVFLATEGVIETTRQSLAVYRDPKTQTLEKYDKDITESAIEQFVNRTVQGNPENTLARSAESALTCILARMSIDRNREVTWQEMMAEG